MDESKLATALPCPFCGEETVSVREGSTFRWMYAVCDNCGAQAGEVRVQTLGDGTKDRWAETGRREAMDEWNKRTAHQAQDGDAKDATLKWALDAGGVLADWCNKSGDALHAMMAAYERRVRSLCTPEEIEKEPWRCAEFIGAESVLREKPTWGYVISQASAPPPQQEAQS